MDKYIQQLVEDLELAAKNPPKPSYIETPPGFEDQQSIVHLGLTPFKTIEQLTGISQEAFPEFNQLEARHWRAVLDAIFKVLDSLKIKLVDAPRGIPKEWLYEAITFNWKQQVQYLPEEGMDLELCTGDPSDCPYGMYCTCDIKWPDDEEYFEVEMEIPKKYVPLLPKIASAIGSGWVCVLPETLELKTISPGAYYTTEDQEALGQFLSGDDDDTFFPSLMLTFEPLLIYEREQMMEDFATYLDQEPLRGKLLEALIAKNPEESFTAIVLQSEEKQNWLSFKQNWLEEHVRAIIWQETRSRNFNGFEINGLYNDDGTRIDPETVPTPSLCMLCKSFYDGDPEENILCVLNRNDQRNDPDFKCGVFEKI
jgi:hypothetical protein